MGKGKRPASWCWLISRKVSDFGMQLDAGKRLNLKSKVWLEVEGRPVIGLGRVTMLQAIDRCGSIFHAAQETGISYRKMRGAIRDMESAMGRPLVRVQRGGETGGGAVLTGFARQLLEAFETFSRDVQNEADRRFEALFR